MQKKLIRGILHKKFHNWAESISDPVVKELVVKNSIITGGCIVSLLLNEEVNDFDVYFTNKETVIAVAKYYTGVFEKSHGYEEGSIKVVCDGDLYSEDPSKFLTPPLDKDRVRIFIESQGIAEDVNNEDLEEEGPKELNKEDIKFEPEKERKSSKTKKYDPVYITSNAITLKDKIQIIVRFYGDAEKIHSNFDFVHCTNYWQSWNNSLHYNINALDSILCKTLYYLGSKYPLASVIRTRKFIKKGWRINAGEYLKMCYQISKLNLDNVLVLEDQLVGVDQAYFNMIIYNIQKEIKENKDFKLDENYLVKLINRIFNDEEENE